MRRMAWFTCVTIFFGLMMVPVATSHAPARAQTCTLTGTITGATVAAGSTCVVQGVVESTGSVIVRGTLKFSAGSTLRFVGVDESRYRGGGGDHPSTRGLREHRHRGVGGRHGRARHIGVSRRHRLESHRQRPHVAGDRHAGHLTGRLPRRRPPSLPVRGAGAPLQRTGVRSAPRRRGAQPHPRLRHRRHPDRPRPRDAQRSRPADDHQPEAAAPGGEPRARAIPAPLPPHGRRRTRLAGRERGDPRLQAARLRHPCLARHHHP